MSRTVSALSIYSILLSCLAGSRGGRARWLKSDSKMIDGGAQEVVIVGREICVDGGEDVGGGRRESGTSYICLAVAEFHFNSTFDRTRFVRHVTGGKVLGLCDRAVFSVQQVGAKHGCLEHGCMRTLCDWRHAVCAAVFIHDNSLNWYCTSGAVICRRRCATHRTSSLRPKHLLAIPANKLKIKRPER